MAAAIPLNNEAVTEQHVAILEARIRDFTEESIQRVNGPVVNEAYEKAKKAVETLRTKFDAFGTMTANAPLDFPALRKEAHDAVVALVENFINIGIMNGIFADMAEAQELMPSFEGLTFPPPAPIGPVAEASRPNLQDSVLNTGFLPPGNEENQQQ